MIVPDAFGWELNNSRILADAYAKRVGNVTVYLPEFMDGGIYRTKSGIDGLAVLMVWRQAITWTP